MRHPKSPYIYPLRHDIGYLTPSFPTHQQYASDVGVAAWGSSYQLEGHVSRIAARGLSELCVEQWQLLGLCS